MAQDQGYDFAAGPSVTLLSADVTTGNSSSLTSAVDFGTPTPVGFGYELIITAGAGAIGSVSLEVVWSHDNTDFSDTNNTQYIDSITCTASGDAKKVGATAIKARYAKFRITNNSGGTVDGTASNTALVLTDIFFDQV